MIISFVLISFVNTFYFLHNTHLPKEMAIVLIHKKQICILFQIIVLNYHCARHAKYQTSYTIINLEYIQFSPRKSIIHSSFMFRMLG